MKQMTRFTLFVLLFALIAGAQLVFAEQVSSIPFTPGDLVVYRVGDGNLLSGSGPSAPIFLDEYTTSGTWVQSVPVPIAGANMMSASMTATSEGFLTLSNDGKHLLLTGYRAAPGIAGIAGTDAATYPRVVASIDASANLYTRDLSPTTFSKNNIRSAASTNGSDIWVSGAAGSGGVGGVLYLSLTGTGETPLSTSFTNARQLEIFGNQLYASSSSGTNTFKGVDMIGAGLPTTAPQTVTRLPGLSDTANPSDYSFFMADLDANVPGIDTMYIADDSSGGVNKFSLVGGIWTSNGNKGSASNSYRGLTGYVSGSTVTLYVTRKGGSDTAGGGELASLVDTSGYNASISGSFTQLATAGTNIAFRGVAFVPVPEPSAFIALITGIFTFLGYLRMSRKHNG
jgi:hypothetical protein